MSPLLIFMIFVRPPDTNAVAEEYDEKTDRTAIAKKIKFIIPRVGSQGMDFFALKLLVERKEEFLSKKKHRIRCVSVSPPYN